ncbi:Wzz/FepE/Etk N-terminal domain-containing protein [Pseudoalteromonas carrageenovora]|uniref:Wzz/FepE/Etk N-terminal domain-containing protein n=1 Tax=Pseudoalteromonas carrageenovora TaxID=227 RepID=UPI0026E2CE7A|nr:Wzz/FepE/Etk N-terminal domain-containing protein [Pseudoalteromonas carrageenovora]MDO6548926.1 Wzz/FepE/Etk N-terminal domain-containing protein [Pseudoalteromonas carrageenovora]MDO6833431.1 Wzz/FepE/Etk N-terminal domain-containing protein [Pseudoalteromonas carrageenovora]
MDKKHLPQDEVDLKELFQFMWVKKFTIAVTTLILVIITVVYAIQLPNIYKAEALLTPAEQQKSGGLASLAGQFGGIASLAGVDLGGGTSSSQTGLAIEVLNSRKFTGEFIERHNILKDLMAVESWNLSNNKVIYDKDIFNPETEEWVRNVEPPFQQKPSLQEAYIKFQEALNVELDSESGMIRISVEHRSPYIAKKWVDWLIKDINQVMRVRDVDEAEKSTVFLNEQLNRTDVSNMKSILYSLLEEQAKTIMFANVRTEYVFKTIDPAVVPEKKFKPSRALICILGAMAGFLISLFIVSIMYLQSDSEKYTYEQQNG